MPLTHVAPPPSYNPSSTPQFVLHIYESLLLCPPPCFYIIFVSLPLCSSVFLLKSSYEWSHMIFVFLWLISLSIIPSSSIHAVANGKISFFWLPSNTPLCIYIYHIFFIHSSIDGHLGSFHTLAIVDSAAINMGVDVFLRNSTPVSLG